MFLDQASVISFVSYLKQLRQRKVICFKVTWLDEPGLRTDLLA